MATTHLKTETIGEKIDRLIGYFHDQQSFVQAIEIAVPHQKRDTNTYKKLRYSSLIDALSQTCFPKYSNRKRFISFVKRFSNWHDYTKISLPHLAQTLKLSHDPSLDGLRGLVHAKFSTWGSGEIRHLTSDLSCRDITDALPIKKIGKLVAREVFEKLNKLKHVHLLYDNRNALIHQLNDKSFIEMAGEETPYYLSYYGPMSEEGWALVYPVKFYEKLILNSLMAYHNYLHKNKIDPFHALRQGVYWKDALN